MDIISVRYNDIFDQELDPNSNYTFTVSLSASTVPPPAPTTSKYCAFTLYVVHQDMYKNLLQHW